MISFSLKENINILIDKKIDLLSEKFKNEILSNGNINFYDGEKITFIKCFNKKISNPESYKCFQVERKKYIILYYYIFSFLENRQKI